MRKLLPFITALLFISACKSKPVSLSGNDKVEFKDFAAAFKQVSLPYRLADTNFVKASDTLTISYSVLTQFVPDSVIKKIFPKNGGKLKIHPAGKIEKEKELYLLANLTSGKKTILAAFLFTNEEAAKYLSNILLLKQGGDDNYMRSISVTNEPTFIISREKYNQKGELMYTRNGYAYNNGSGEFIEVVNDSNEDLKRLAEIINPIDTLPRKFKYSADYAEDKKNFISIRDGSNATRYEFFLHFEKDGGKCTGELKGTMAMSDATHGYYRESGDPCVIDFTFEGRQITIKEQGNCGNHRGIKCYFDDTYTKRKETKNVAQKSK